jgi:hypothetical protein
MTQQYSVEARLVYLFEPSGSADLEREIKMLTNPQVLINTARELSSAHSKISKDNRPFAMRSALVNKVSATHAPALASTGTSAAGVLQWFTQNLVVVPEFTPGIARVRLTLQGKDPEFLQRALDAYLSRYAEWRRNLDASLDRSLFGLADQQRTFSSQAAESTTATHQLQQIEFQKWNLQLALKLLDSTKSPFAGFIPTSSIQGGAPLNRFQDKIAELEIKKACLAVRFMPSSPEIREVDLEIQAVKNAMRACIIENIRFLSDGGEFLAARKRENQFHEGPAIMTRSVTSSEGMPWFVALDGIYVLLEGPDVINQSLYGMVASSGAKLVSWWRPSAKTVLISQHSGFDDNGVVLAGGVGESAGVQSP